MLNSGPRKRISPLFRTLGLLALAIAGAASVHAQPVQGDVRSVGFQAAVPTRFVIRHGEWFPILVELTAQGSQPQEVELRCEREDLDGDRVAYVEPYVTVNPNSLRRVWCYAVSLKEDAGWSVKLDVVGRRDGALITTLPVPAFEAISNNTQLVLDISAKRITALDWLDSGQMAYTGLNLGNRRFYRSICVATLPAKDLPDRWYGLEAVDVIVWDEPDPDALPNPAQLSALVEWVRNGGQLVVGIGPAWTKIQKSALAEIMPLTGNQPPLEVRELGTFVRRYARKPDEGFKAPIAVAVGEPAPGALVTFQERLPGLARPPINLISMKCVGSGRVIATAARLCDLANPGLSVSREFYQELFDLNENEKGFLDNEGKQLYLSPAELYEPLIEKIEFRRLASVHVLAAFAFVAAYVLLSTFGAWSWLKRHTLTHVSWTAFAVFAIVASLLSVAAVGLTRGVTGTMHSLSFVDLEAGSKEARAAAYFGYKSNRRQRIDVSLPGEGDYLRPLATGGDLSGKYATPERYVAITGKAILADTPMRATLKQFEGVWHGSLEGMIRGSLTADRESGEITPQSWLQNDLDVDLGGGYLLYIDPRLREPGGGVPYRVAGLTHSFQDRYYDSKTVPPAVNVLAVEIPAMRPGEKVSQLGAKEYAEYDPRRARWHLQGGKQDKNQPMLRTLRHRQLEEWITSSGPLGGALDPGAAALLLSTRNLYLHNSRVTEFDSIGRPVSTAGLVDHDVTHWLTRGQAVLLLLSDEPGPATACLNGGPKESKEGYSVYRVRIPIQYAGQPPRGGTP
jgi:hypothetical protein